MNHAQFMHKCSNNDHHECVWMQAMDLFDMSNGYSSLEEGVQRVICPILVLGVTSDVLFPVQQQRDMSEVLQKSGNRNTTYYELTSIYGHDTFLLDVMNVGTAVKGHLESTLTI
ncbi:Serine O-succinyltransferase [Geodia barretti]|uniref:Serine O-succinyltransferase n=1 Tax=Geodia barretti TaxID=519541 RepID=A0AA35SZT6_GEOBA|nr:Serine O-succinyltransferase [Geodia barretti]